MAMFKLSEFGNFRKAMRKAGTQKGEGRIAKLLGHIRGKGAFHLAVQQLASKQGKKFGTFQDFLDWIIENWDEIMKIVMAILPLFI